jgi:hypothetical protein
LLKGQVNFVGNGITIETSRNSHCLLFQGPTSCTTLVRICLCILKGRVTVEINPFDELWVHVDTVTSSKNDTASEFNCKRSDLLQLFTRIPCEPWL